MGMGYRSEREKKKKKNQSPDEESRPDIMDKKDKFKASYCTYNY